MIANGFFNISFQPVNSLSYDQHSDHNQVLPVNQNFQQVYLGTLLMAYRISEFHISNCAFYEHYTRNTTLIIV